MSDAKSAAAGGAAVAAAASAAAAAAPASNSPSSASAGDAIKGDAAASSPASAAANNKAAAASAATASPPAGGGDRQPANPGPSSLPNNPPGTVTGTIAYAGGRYSGALLNGVPHGFGTLERGSGGADSLQFRGIWEHGHLHVGVRSCARERLHYEGQLCNLERQGMGIEWRVVETPLASAAAAAAAAAAASSSAAAAPPAPTTRIIGEVHRAGGWSHDERVAECPVPRKFLPEMRFIAEADKSLGLELVMPDGTAGHYEGERNERGEPHGRGRVLNARGEAVAGDTWVDGAQEGECFYHQADGEQYVGGLVRGFKSGHGRHSFPDGEVYEGQWLANLKHGLGCQTWDDGYEFEGEWRHDEQTGFGIEYTRAGKISACGRWLHSEMKEWHAVPRAVLPKGKFLSDKAKTSQLLYSDGGYYKGAVNEKSEAHGKGILYTAAHQIVQGGRFQHGKLDGEGFTNHPDGGRYAGEHRGGLREGIGKLQLANGDKYSGNFHSNLQHGRGVYTWAKGDVYDGSWSDVRMHGVGKYSWPDGIVYIGEWVAGVQSGLGFKWSGLGTKAQFGRWLDNKFVQTLYVAPAILAKMPSWTVEEFTHELETRWAEYHRPSVPQLMGPAAPATAGAATGSNANAAATTASGNGGNAKGKKGSHGKDNGDAKGNGHGHGSAGAAAHPPAQSPACICTCSYKCACKCACPCSTCSAGSAADEWSPEVFELIQRMRAAYDVEPHLMLMTTQAQAAQAAANGNANGANGHN